MEQTEALMSQRAAVCVGIRQSPSTSLWKDSEGKGRDERSFDWESTVSRP